MRQAFSLGAGWARLEGLDMAVQKLKIAAVQLQTRMGDVAASIAAAEHLAEQAFAEGAELVALPEFFTGMIAPARPPSASCCPPTTPPSPCSRAGRPGTAGASAAPCW